MKCFSVASNLGGAFWILLHMRLNGVSAGLCEAMEAVAGGRLGHECGCNESICSHACSTEDNGAGWCTNGCEYCTGTNCVTYYTVAVVLDGRDFDIGVTRTNTVGYTYTKGPYAGLQLILSIPVLMPWSGGCSLKLINDNDGSEAACGCEMYYCDDAQTIANAVVDCSAIEAGATANFCKPSDFFEIPTLEGILSAFLIPSIVDQVCDEPGSVAQVDSTGSDVDGTAFLPAEDPAFPTSNNNKGQISLGHRVDFGGMAKTCVVGTLLGHLWLL